MLREEIIETLKYLKVGKAPGPANVYAEMILHSGDVDIRVLMQLCQITQDGKIMQEDRATSVGIHIFKGKGDTVTCIWV